MTEIPAYQNSSDWHFASMRYGDYVAFNGDIEFMLLVTSMSSHFSLAELFYLIAL